MNDTLLAVEGLKRHFRAGGGLILGGPRRSVRAVDGVDLSIGKQETLGLVGESGCGKTTTAKLILLLERPTAGTITFDGKDVLSLRGSALLGYRRSVQAVFQDPTSSLNPRMRVRDIIAEPIVATKALPKEKIAERVAECLVQTGLHESHGSLYPHEFSGGQRQRIAVARAIASKPELIVLDEPVSSLDVSIRAQLLKLLRELQERIGIAYLMIAHDLAAVRYLSRRIAVMYLGKLVEMGDAEDVYANPLHPYTRALLSAVLSIRPNRDEIVLTGDVPDSLDLPSGCAFRPRCPQPIPRCSDEQPALRKVEGSRQVACHLCV